MEKDVLGYWEAIELVKPAEINAGSAPFWPERRSTPIEFQLTADADDQLPWCLPDLPLPRDGHDILYTAFLGLYDASSYNAAAGIEQTRAANQNTIPYGVLSLLLAGDGRVLLRGTQISSAPWALAMLRSEGAKALNGDSWDSLCRRLQTGLEKRWAGKTPAFADFQAIIQRVLEVCQSDLSVRPTIRIKAQEVSVPGEKTLEDWVAALADLKEEPDQLITSRLYGDVSTARKLGHHPSLSAYISRRPQALEVDAIRDREAILSDLDPARLSLPCWPSNGHRTLNLAQRFTLQRLRADLADGGLFAVNGPPGTGKTTLIRELAADLLTERARAMTQFDDPVRAFAGGVPDTIIGYEMVVCTQSNRAAQRVSVELPRRNEIDPRWREAIGLFRPVMAQVAHAYEQIVGVDLADAWGTFALPLGKQKLRRACAEALWSDPKRAQREGRWTLGRLLFQDFEEDAAPPVPDWKKARERFRRAEAAVHREIAKARDAYQAMHDERRLEALRAKQLCGRQAERAELAQLECNAAADDASAKSKVSELALVFDASSDDIRDRIERHLQVLGTEVRELEETRRRNPPVNGRMAYNRWTEAGSRLSVVRDKIRRLDAALHDYPRLFRRLKERTGGRAADDPTLNLLEERLSDQQAQTLVELREWRAAEQATRATREARAQRIAELRSLIEQEERGLAAEIGALERRLAQVKPLAMQQFGANAVGAAAWADGGRDVEMSAPWVGEPVRDGEPGPLQAARVELFLAALEVHEAFIVAARKQVRSYLQGLFAMLRGEPGWREAYAQQAPMTDLWRVFFLCVPIVSTTFHSVRRLFTGVGPKAFGWSIIDEAGQAEPQAAVGALLRARRTVVLGDPMQLEPISEIPDELADRLAAKLPDSAEWDPRWQSAQTLADRRAPVGTVINTGGQRGRRVGSPLRVHWRCDEPMASLSAQIAYGDLMVPGTPKRAAVDLPASGWLDVPRRPDDGGRGHHVLDEEAPLMRLLDTVDAAAQGVYVITPFRDVDAGLKLRLKGSHHADKVTERRVGTVHTFQGREEDVVIVVLGGRTSLRAREFTHDKPNFLNVAVTRAKRRLYVIGDRTSWASLPFFQDLAAVLPALVIGDLADRRGSRTPISAPNN